MRIKPKRGHVLIELLDPPSMTESGLALPEEAQDKPRKGIVREIGAWPVTGKGLMVPTQLRKGMKVYFNDRSGRRLNTQYGPMKIMPESKVLAVLEETH